MATDLGTEGVLGAFIWPVYVGLCQTEPDPACTGEPFLNADYQRGQIAWVVQPDDTIVGHATILVPPGTYTYLTYHYGPSVWPAGPQLMGYRRLEFAMQFPTATAVNIDPINQGDWLNAPRTASRLSV